MEIVEEGSVRYVYSRNIVSLLALSRYSSKYVPPLVLSYGRAIPLFTRIARGVRWSWTEERVLRGRRCPGKTCRTGSVYSQKQSK